MQPVLTIDSASDRTRNRAALSLSEINLANRIQTQALTLYFPLEKLEKAPQ
jgi:hypothetical protein